MILARFFSIAVTGPMLFLAGCADSVPREKPRERNVPGELERSIPAKAKASDRINAEIEISHAAKDQLARITGQPQGARVRLEFTPEGCTGMKTHLAIQHDDLGPQDAAQDCGGIYCVFPMDQFPLAQGALIDWKEKEKGFTVTFPKKTRENQIKTTKWINDEAEKRLKKLDEQDRAAGRLAERIAEMRKLSLDDPHNELGHFRLGQLLMVDGQHAEAVKCFDRTLAIVPDFSKAAQLLGECLIKTGQRERAIEVLSKGWTTADNRADEPAREAMTALLLSVGAPIPQSVSNKK